MPASAARIVREINKLDLVALQPSDESEDLAEAYLRAGFIPSKKRDDARHVAIATVAGVEVLVSWNHRHLTRPLKRLQYEAVNRLHGYVKTPLICNPLEVLHELRD